MKLYEVWKDVTGFEGLYMVSSFGRIKGCSKLIKHYKGGFSRRKERILKTSEDRYGYLKVVLQRDKKRLHTTVHRVVAKAFLKNPNNLPQVNHEDGNKKNNRVDNLTWCNTSYNIRHAIDNGLIDHEKVSGENCYITNLTNELVLEIRDKMKNGIKNKEIEKEYKLSRSAVSRIRNRKSFKNI